MRCFEMWTVATFVAGCILMLGTYVDATCSDTKLHGLDHRSPDYTVQSDNIVNDYYLSTKWYHTSNDYLMVDEAPDVGKCGTNWPIYLNGSHPNVATLNETAYKYIACMKTYSNECSSQLEVEIRLCDGRVEYRLPTSEFTQSAYCFERTSERLYPNVSVGNVSVLPTLRFELLTTLEFQPYQPYLDFHCNFNKTATYFYTVEWYHDGIYYKTLGPSNNMSELVLTEETLLADGKRLGTTFQCGVSASYNASGLTTAIKYSDNYFAGIVMSSQVVSMKKDENYTLTFKLTAPLGCRHPQNRSLLYTTTYGLNMFDRNFTCSGATIMSLNDQRNCGADITCLREGDTWNPEQLFSVAIMARSVKTNDPTTYTLDFRMQSDIYHDIWDSYQPSSVTVHITNDEVYHHKRCYSHVDPHYRTVDGYYYDQQKEGYFVLYRNQKYGIEVQERTKRCGPRATCTCALAIQAGGDIIIVDTCDGKKLINYKQCDDGGILKLIEKSDTLFEVHTPIGTYITFCVIYKTFLNVDIYMAPSDLGNTVGLCGTYDGNIANDLTKPDGTMVPLSSASRRLHYDFSDAWNITDQTKNIFSPNYAHPGLWSDSNSLFCYCKNQTRVNSAFCGGTQFPDDPNCTDTSSVTDKYCTWVTARRKRSTKFLEEEFERRLRLSFERNNNKRVKKSTTDIKEKETTAYCTDLLRNSAAAGFTNIFSEDDISATVSECSFDIVALQDYTIASAHWDAMNNIVKVELEKDPVYVANNSDQVSFFIQNSCENNCSGNGVCSSEGSCICEGTYAGSDCSIDVTVGLVIDYVTAFGICDLQHQSDCTCYDFLTTDLLENFKCRSQELLVDKNGNNHSQSSVTYAGDYLNMFEGECCFPTTRTELTSVDGGFYYQYTLSLSNDGTNFGNPYWIYIYDSTCQQNETNQDGHVTFSLKSDYCFIDGVCVANADTDIANSCFVCNVSANVYAWSNGCPTTTSEKKSNSLLVIILAVAGGTILFLVVLTVICVKICKSSGPSRKPSQRQQPENNVRPRRNQRSASEISIRFDASGRS